MNQASLDHLTQPKSGCAETLSCMLCPVPQRFHVKPGGWLGCYTDDSTDGLLQVP